MRESVGKKKKRSNMNPAEDPSVYQVHDKINCTMMNVLQLMNRWGLKYSFSETSNCKPVNLNC